MVEISAASMMVDDCTQLYSVFYHILRLSQHVTPDTTTERAHFGFRSLEAFSNAKSKPLSSHEGLYLSHPGQNKNDLNDTVPRYP